MANPLVGRCEALAAAGRHITAVTATQRGETEYEVRITLQDWATGDELLAGEGGVIAMCTRAGGEEILRQLFCFLPTHRILSVER